MTDTHSSHQWLNEAQHLAFSAELLAVCDAQHAFIDHDVDEEVVRQKAVGLAREARRRRRKPQVLLLAMELGGCYRSGQQGLEDVRNGHHLPAAEAFSVMPRELLSQQRSDGPHD